MELKMKSYRVPRGRRRGGKVKKIYYVGGYRV